MTAAKNETPEQMAQRKARLAVDRARFIENNPGYFKAYRDNISPVAKYGITNEQKSEMWDDQGRACAICLQPTDKPHVDHDHATGRTRGLLCRKCNLGLGHFNDNPIALASAIAYLERTS